MTITGELLLIIIGLILIIGTMAFMLWQDAYSSSSNNNGGNLTLDCIRMFFSDEWNKGYVESLSEYCRGVR